MDYSLVAVLVFIGGMLTLMFLVFGLNSLSASTIDGNYLNVNYNGSHVVRILGIDSSSHSRQCVYELNNTRHEIECSDKKLPGDNMTLSSYGQVIPNQNSRFNSTIYDVYTNIFYPHEMDCYFELPRDGYLEELHHAVCPNLALKGDKVLISYHGADDSYIITKDYSSNVQH